MEEREQIDLKVKRLSIFDFSSEDENFIANLSSSPLRTIGLEQSEHLKESISLELFETMDGQEGKDICHSNEEDDIFPELCESMEPERTKLKGNPKPRMSLAWNSAFFTDPGVLDPEELSSMIKGAEKGEKHILSGHNDVEQSFDSISTFESDDDLILEQLEAEFFEDIRASIARSSKVLNVMIPSSSKQASPKAVDDEATSALKNADYTSKNAPVPKVAPKRNIRAQTSGMSKSQRKQSDGVQSSGKTVTKENSQVTQAIARTLDSNSLLARPRKLSSKVNSVSATIAKGTSMDASHVKIDHVNAKINNVAGKGAQASKVSATNNARKVLPKSVSSLKPSSIVFSASDKMSPRSSSDSTASTSSEKSGKSTFPAARRKVESKTIGQPSSGSIIKSTSKIATKVDISSRNSAVGAYVMSSKMSPGFSPASSISEWSSRSSSSSSSINKRSNGSRTSLDTSRSVDSDCLPLDLTKSSSHYQTSVPKTALPNEYISKPSRLNGTVSQPPSMKPSGLRMPSPKIGFFDRVKSDCTPRGSMQNHSNGSVGLTKLGANTRTNTKAKTAKLPPEKTLTRAERDTETVPSHISVKDKLPVPVNISGAPGDVEYNSCSSEEVNHEMSGNSNLYPKDVAVEGPEIFKHVTDAGFIPGDRRDQGLMKNGTRTDINLNPNLDDIKIIAVEGNSNDSVSKNTKTMRSEFLDFCIEAADEALLEVHQ